MHCSQKNTRHESVPIPHSYNFTIASMHSGSLSTSHIYFMHFSPKHISYVQKLTGSAGSGICTYEYASTNKTATINIDFIIILLK